MNNNSNFTIQKKNQNLSLNNLQHTNQIIPIFQKHLLIKQHEYFNNNYYKENIIKNKSIKNKINTNKFSILNHNEILELILKRYINYTNYIITNQTQILNTNEYDLIKSQYSVYFSYFFITNKKYLNIFKYFFDLELIKLILNKNLILKFKQKYLQVLTLKKRKIIKNLKKKKNKNSNLIKIIKPLKKYLKKSPNKNKNYKNWEIKHIFILKQKIFKFYSKHITLNYIKNFIKFYPNLINNIIFNINKKLYFYLTIQIYLANFIILYLNLLILINKIEILKIKNNYKKELLEQKKLEEIKLLFDILKNNENNLKKIIKPNLILKLWLKNTSKPLNISNKNKLILEYTITKFQKLNNKFNPIKDTFLANSYPVLSLPQNMLYFYNVNKTNKNINNNYKLNLMQPRINNYIKSISMFNYFNKGPIIFFSKYISYNFNFQNNKFVTGIYSFLTTVFLRMKCLISKPVFIVTPDKVIIQLFYYFHQKNRQKIRIKINKNLSNKKLQLIKKFKLNKKQNNINKINILPVTKFNNLQINNKNLNNINNKQFLLNKYYVNYKNYINKLIYIKKFSNNKINLLLLKKFTLINKFSNNLSLHKKIYVFSRLISLLKFKFKFNYLEYKNKFKLSLQKNKINNFSLKSVKLNNYNNKLKNITKKRWRRKQFNKFFNKFRRRYIYKFKNIYIKKAFIIIKRNLKNPNILIWNNWIPDYIKNNQNLINKIIWNRNKTKGILYLKIKKVSLLNRKNNYNKFNNICEILNLLFKKNVELDLIRLHYPYTDSNILVNLLSLLIKKMKVRIIIKKLLKKAVIKNKSLNLVNKNKKMYFIPTFISGIKIKIGGRLMTHRLIPRKTVTVFSRGIITNSRVNFSNIARFTRKNKRGAFSITVSSGHNFR